MRSYQQTCYATALTLISLTFASTASVAATWNVNPDGSGDFPTIQDAIDAANDGDLILLGTGVFHGPGNRNVDGLGKALTIRGNVPDPSACVIDCQGSSADPARGFYFHSGESTGGTTLEGITVRGGYAPTFPVDSWGGGLLCIDSSITLRHCVFVENEAGWGGGLLFWGSASYVEQVWVADNEALTNGGGIYCTTGDRTEFVYVTVVGNTTLGRGGALVANDCMPSLSHCTLHGNGDLGGAIWILNGASPTVSNSIISENPSGAVDCNGGSISFVCTDIFGNAGGDWTGCIAGQNGTNGNFRSDPLYCDANGRDFSISSASPCSPGENPGCGLIGAWPVACGPVPVLESSWGGVKALFR